MTKLCNFFKHGTLIVSLMIISKIILGQSKKVVINKRITYFDAPSVQRTTWRNASDRCASIGMGLCMKKDLCEFSRRFTSKIPRVFVKRTIVDRYIPVGDAYNDWIYVGPRKLNQCQRMTEYAGPPIWRGNGCKQAVKPSKVFKRFCQSSSGIYCCKRTDTKALLPYPVSVYVSRYNQSDSKIFYSYSVDAAKADSQNNNKWEKNVPKDVQKFSLMSMRVAGKFEDPIFFCSRQVKKENGDLVDYFYIANRWCNWGWKLNFYLYGSLTHLPNAQKFEANAVDFGKNLRSRLTVNGKLSRSPASFVFYGPKYQDGTHFEYFQNSEPKATCTKEPKLLTSVEGFIDSRQIDVNNGTCRWKIRAPTNSVVKINFLRLNLKPRATIFTNHQSSISSNQYVARRIANYNFFKKCSEERVEIFGYGRFCGNTLPPAFVTIDNEIDIAFSRSGEKTEESQISEFSLSYQVVAPPNGLIRKKLFDTKLTWVGANDTCAAMAKALCKASDICEHTRGRPFYGIQENDQWTPINDEFNDWLQIGRGNVQTCRRHNNMFGPPLWGLFGAECNVSNEYIPCPKRDYLYCCNPSNSLPQTEDIVDVLIYSVTLHGTVFFKYLRKGIDELSSFDDKNFLRWTRTKKADQDIEKMKLNSHYSPLFDKPLYFCQREVVPALEGLRLVYSVLSQPCTSQGWKYLYHLYGMSTFHPGTAKHYVGIYERRPHHTRIQTENVAKDYGSQGSYIFYSRIPQFIMADSEPVPVVEMSLCGELDSNVLAPAVVMSPGYPKSYRNHLDCNWVIKKPSNAREDEVLRLTVTELDLEDPVDILTIGMHSGNTVDGSTSPDRVRTLTGIVRQVTMETTGYFKLHFVSDASVSKKGFRIKVDIISAHCGGAVRTDGDYITSPSYPSSYPINAECEWLIEAPSKNYDIEIQVVTLDLISDEECSDKVMITSRHIESDFVLCGNKTSTDKMFLNGSTAAVYLYTSNSDPKTVKTHTGFAFQVYFREKRPSAIPLQCGVQSVPFGYSDPVEERIVGGTKATVANFPWLVHIEGKVTYCAGTLVSKSWVLTAAHCLIKDLDGLGGRILYGDVKTFKLIAGRNKRYIHNKGEQVRRAIHAHFRTDYRQLMHLIVLNGNFTLSYYAYNDIVLLKMDKDVDFSPLVQPICLPTQDAHVGDTCYVAGWGDITSDRTRSIFLHYTKAPILESELCNSYPLMRRTVYENAICAGYPSGGSGMCYGDSGGPLFCRGKYGNFYMNGITSWSVGCAVQKAPGVYTRVFNFVDWIKKTIGNTA